MAKISRIEPKIPALKKRQKVAAYARVSMEILGSAGPGRRRAASSSALLRTARRGRWTSC